MRNEGAGVSHFLVHINREWQWGGQEQIEGWQRSLGNGGDSVGMSKGGLGDTVDYWAVVDMC